MAEGYLLLNPDGGGLIVVKSGWRRDNCCQIWMAEVYTLPFEWNKLEDSRFQTNRITFQIELKNSLLEQLNGE